MLESKYVFAAAEAVISVVEEDHKGRRPGPDQGGFYTLEGEVASELYKHLDMTFEQALGQALSQARHEEIGVRLGHLDQRDLADGDWHENQGGETQTEKLRTLFARALEKLEELTDHRCEFGEDDYCITCSCDGRA